MKNLSYFRNAKVRKSGGGSQGGCERRIEVIVQCKKEREKKVGGRSGFGSGLM